jgi:hypothetical protein
MWCSTESGGYDALRYTLTFYLSKSCIFFTQYKFILVCTVFLLIIKNYMCLISFLCFLLSLVQCQLCCVFIGARVVVSCATIYHSYCTSTFFRMGTLVFL